MPAKALREATPQARHSFTVADQVDRLVRASEADPDMGFMARLMALCSLPRRNTGNTGGVAGDLGGRLPSTGLLNGGGGPPTDQLAGEPDPPRLGWQLKRVPSYHSASDRSIGGPRGEKKKC